MGLYTISYGGTTLDVDIVEPPKRSINADEPMTETWVFRCYSSSTDADGLNTKISALVTLLEQHDLALIITRNAQNVINLSTSSRTGYNVRATLRKIGDPTFDLTAGQQVEIAFTFNRPVIQTTTDIWGVSYANRKAVRVNLDFDSARRRVITISCIYMGSTVSGVETAKKAYDALHAAWAAAILADVTGGGNMQDRLLPSGAVGEYKLLSERVGDMNRFDAEVAVTTTYLELLENDDDSSSGTPKNNPILVDTHWSFMRRNGQKFGRSTLGYGPGNSDMPVQVRVTYQTNVPWSILDSAARWELPKAFHTYIRGIMVSRARTNLDLPSGTWKALSGEIVFEPTPTSRQIKATLDIIFVKGSTLTPGGGGAAPSLWIEFSETVDVTDDARNRYRKILDGEQDDYDVYTPGRMVTLIVTTTCLTYEAAAPEPPILGLPWRFDNRRRSLKTEFVDTTDTRSAGAVFTTQQPKSVFLTMYTTHYTLVNPSKQGGGRGAVLTPAPGEFSTDNPFNRDIQT